MKKQEQNPAEIQEGSSSSSVYVILIFTSLQTSKHKYKEREIHLFDDKMNTCHGRLPRPNPLLPRSSNKFSINLPTTLSLYIYHVAEIQAAVFCFFLETKIIAIKNKNTKEKNGTIVLRLHGFVVVSLSFVLLLTQREREREREREVFWLLRVFVVACFPLSILQLPIFIYCFDIS
jgi:hypothetical protein